MPSASTAVRARTLLAWSSGKDSAWSLHLLRQRSDLEVVGLLTTFNQSADRVAMHAVRRQLVESQARSAGLPLIPVWLPWPCSNAIYEAAIQRALKRASEELDATHIAFGDLFLEDVRAYREKQLAQTGFTPIFPIWGLPTDRLAREMVDNGLKAHLTCIDPRQLSREFAGRRFDHELLQALPETVDPCGERGEFHTFVFEGPMFSAPIPVATGAIVERDGFVFMDLLPKVQEAASEP